MYAQTNLYFEHIDDPGLTTTVVRAIVQDNDGFVYVGTNDGFFKYNGYTFKKYSSSAAGKFACPLQNIRILFYDEKYIWLSGTEGLAKLDLQTKEFTLIHLTPSEIKKDRISVKNIKRFSDTEIIVGTYRAFNIINTETNAIKHFDMPPDFPDNDYSYITSFFKDTKNNIWLGSVKTGLYCYTPGSKMPVSHKENPALEKLANYSIPDMLPYGDDKALLATTGGVFLFNAATLECNQIYLSPDKNPEHEPNIRKIIKTGNNGELLIATYGSGLYQYFPEQKKAVQYVYEEYWYNSIAENYVNDIVEGRNNMFWVATENSGIDKINGWMSRYDYVLLPPLDDAGGTTMVSDVHPYKDDVWLATTLGLFRYTKDRNIKYYDISPIYKIGYLLNIQQINENYLAFEVYDEGVGLFNLKTNQYSFLQPPGKNIEGRVAAFDWLSFTDDENNYYVTDFEGNYLKCNYSNNTVDTLFTPKEVTLYLPLVIPQTKTELIVISDTKLFSYNTISKKLKPLTADKNGNTIPPVSFQEDIIVRPNGDIYIASDEGFFMYSTEENTLKRYTEADGLLSDNCSSLSENSAHEIYIEFAGGFEKFDETNHTFTAYLFPKVVAASPSPIFGSDGKFYYGADNCFLIAPVDSLQRYTKKPFMRIVSIKAGSKFYDMRNVHDDIVLRHTDFPVELEFELIDHLNPSGNKINYMLDGWDASWLENDRSDFKTIYSKLSSGDYTFKLKGNNAAGNEATILEIPIQVLPPFWQTGWFIAIVIASMLFIPYMVYKYRLNQLKKIHAIRNKIAEDLHDDVGSTLSSIRMYSDIVSSQIKDKNTESITLLEKMSNNAKEMIENMGDIVWAIKPANDIFVNIENRILNFATELCSAKNITFIMERNDALNNLKIPMDQRKDFYLIFKEAVNNAVKYAECTILKITFEKIDSSLSMCISDNGKGFDITQLKQGNGLENMKRRAANINGHIDIQSGTLTGTSITLIMHIS